MDVGTLRGWIAVVTLMTFLGICWWAYRGRNRVRFEEDAGIPFADERSAHPDRVGERDERGAADV